MAYTPGNDANKIIVAPGGKVWVAPVGTAAPADATTAPVAAWIDLGYVSEDGATLRNSQTTEGIGAWQSPYPVRVVLTERAAQLAFALRQWSKDTIPLAFGGGAVTGTPPNFQYDPPAGTDAVDYRAMLVDWVDGTRAYRVVAFKVTLADQVETQLVRTAAADLPLTFDLMADAVTKPFRILTNDANAFGP